MISILFMALTDLKMGLGVTDGDRSPLGSLGETAVWRN